jgi:hypothetical protein
MLQYKLVMIFEFIQANIPATIQVALKLFSSHDRFPSRETTINDDYLTRSIFQPGLH